MIDVVIFIIRNHSKKGIGNRNRQSILFKLVLRLTTQNWAHSSIHTETANGTRTFYPIYTHNRTPNTFIPTTYCKCAAQFIRLTNDLPIMNNYYYPMLHSKRTWMQETIPSLDRRIVKKSWTANMHIKFVHLHLTDALPSNCKPVLFIDSTSTWMQQPF